MLQLLLGLLNYGVILFFGVFVSAAFLGIAFHKKNVLMLLGFCTAAVLLQSVSYALYGYSFTEKIYPLIIHLPLILFLAFSFRKKIPAAMIAMMSAYLCCQLSNWFGILSLALWERRELMYSVRILTNLWIAALILRFIAPSVAVILSKSTKIMLSFGLLPLLYYLFDYLTVVYSHLLYNGSEIILEMLPFILCIAYLIFCVIYFKEYNEKYEIEQHIQLIELQRAQHQKEIANLQNTEYEIARIRHDMRHFLMNIKTCIENDSNATALNSINELITSIDQTTLQRFCENDLVNTVLSYYENRARKNGILYHTTIQIPKDLPCSDMDFTSILANGLENALHAVSQITEGKRYIDISLKMNGDKLLLSIKNPYAVIPEIVDGIPITHAPGHGLGTSSIKSVSEKLNGNYQFMTKNEEFILRVII